MFRSRSSPIQLLLTLVLAALLLGPAGSSAQADVAPPPPPFASGLSTDSADTKVAMLSETVLLDVADLGPTLKGPAWTTAHFTMHNTGDQDEAMQARFPLYSNYDGQCIDSDYPPIQDFGVWVNKKSIRYTTTTATINTRSGATRDVPCWANFPVTFPAGQDVEVSVQYTSDGYEIFTTSGLEEFQYILQSGAGWFGPIGSADVTLKLPYPVSPQNLFDCRVGSDLCQVSGNQVSWHGDNFEPTADFSVDMVNTAVWDSIQTETKNTQVNPGDGEAWGRLGRAYKQSILEKRGFRSDPAAPDLFFKSKASYEKSISLLNSDADWHYGFAELICNAAFYPMPGFGSSSDNQVICLQQIQIILALKPNYQAALDLQQGMSGLGLVDLSGSRPVYLGLTTTPTPVDIEQEPTTPPLTDTPLPSATLEATQPAQPTDTAQPSFTPSQTQAAAQVSTSTPQVAQVESTSTARPQAILSPQSATPTPDKRLVLPRLPLCGGTGALLGLALLAGLWKHWH